MLVNRRQRVVKDIVTFISRKLQGKGEITVKEGAEVSPDDVLGHSFISAGFRNINLATSLDTSPREAKKFLQRDLSQRIYKGELLAYKPAGVLTEQKVITSPTDAEISFYDEKTGNLGLNLIPLKRDLLSSVFGIVEKINRLKNEVIIKTQVTQIFGLLGGGIAREGTLKVLGDRSSLIDKDSIDQHFANHILVGGGLIYSGAINLAVTIGVHGIITGGINAKDYQRMSGDLRFPKKFGTDIGMSVMVCEGFGVAPIGDDIFETAKKFNNKFAILDGNRTKLTLPSWEQESMIVLRKTQLPSYALVEGLAKVEVLDLAIGKRVRIISSPLGEQGEVVAIDQSPTLLPSKIFVNLVTVQTRNRKLRIPYTNLEIIGEG